jgi:predicted Zn-ribbon and HTH transcriptional regulator
VRSGLALCSHQLTLLPFAVCKICLLKYFAKLEDTGKKPMCPRCKSGLDATDAMKQSVR